MGFGPTEVVVVVDAGADGLPIETPNNGPSARGTASTVAAKARMGKMAIILKNEVEPEEDCWCKGSELDDCLVER